jgi:hypothetical protein
MKQLDTDLNSSIDLTNPDQIGSLLDPSGELVPLELAHEDHGDHSDFGSTHNDHADSIGSHGDHGDSPVVC